MGQLMQFLFFVFLYEIVLSSSLSIAQSRLCPHEKSTALLQFKQAIAVDASASSSCEDNGQTSSPRTESWNSSTDCCRWDGVTCDKLTGQVIGLDLSCSQLQGVIDSNSSLFQLSPLQRLNLAYNYFSASEISPNFGELSSLTHLNLSNSGFSGQLPIQFLRLSSLVSLDLRGNMMYGPIPSSLFQLKNLTDLFISSNNFSGVIDVRMFSNMKQLKVLDLSFNSLSLTNNEVNASMPESLQTLLVSSCNITNFDFLRGAKNLVFLDLSSNLLQGPILIPPVSVKAFFASNNNLSGEIPSSICNLSSLDVLVLSNNSFSEVIPQCLGNASSKLSVLDIHMNRLQGQIPEIFGAGSNLKSLNLRNNQLEGSLPRSLSNCKELEVLDLGNNNLNGTFPSWLGILPKLQVLSLRANNFYGPLTTSTSGFLFPALRIIDVSHNEFTGILPARFFRNLEGMMRVDRSSSIRYNGGDYYYKDSVIVIIKGLEIQLMRILSVFTTIDLSSNKFEGEIPDEIGDLLLLRGLNLSHNILGGQIPPALGNLTVLKSLDLSSNQLSGGIPRQLNTLVDLAVLNISENLLAGSIPQRGQLATFVNGSYVGNPGLCGRPLSKRCGDDGLSKPSEPGLKLNEEDEQFLSGFTWKSLLIGYSFGMMLGVVAAWLMFFTGKPKWINKIFQLKVLKMNRRRRKEIRFLSSW